MKKRYSVLILCLLFVCCKTKQHTKSQVEQLGEYEYPFLGQTIDNYFKSYYHYPHNLDDYLAYMKESNYYEEYIDLQPMCAKLAENKKRIKIKEEEEYYTLIENDSVEILKLNKIDICGLLNDDRYDHYLMNTILFFRDQGLILNTYNNNYDESKELRKRLDFLIHKGVLLQSYNWELIHYTRDTIVYDCGKMDVTKPHPDTARMKDTLAVLMQEYKADSLVLVIPVAPLEKIEK